MGMASLVIKSYTNQAKVNWGLVSKVIAKLFVGIYATRRSPFTPYVVHLIYYHEKCLTTKARDEYEDKSDSQFFDFKEETTAWSLARGSKESASSTNAKMEKSINQDH